jgi:hypothetical protein
MPRTAALIPRIDRTLVDGSIGYTWRTPAMKKKIYDSKLLLVAVMIVGPLLCQSLVISAATAQRGSIFDWSKKAPEAFGYLIAYSVREQKVFYTPIFASPAPKTSFDDEEYVSQTPTIIKLEAGFLKHLQRLYSIRPADYTINARPVFKSEEIARNRFHRETDTFRIRGFGLVEVTGFQP